MWGLSLDDYIVYWIGLGICTVIGVVYGVIQLIRGKGRQ